MSNVDHPSHYNANPSGIECIEVVRHMNFNVGNAIKYLWRAGFKNVGGPEADMVRRRQDRAKHIEDLEKAAWYIEDEIKRLNKLPI